MTALTIEREVHFSTARRGQKQLHVGPAAVLAVDPGRVPRVARLMALAIRFKGLLRSGVVKDYAQLARLGHVTPARISQVMSLVYLAPDIQEAVLFLPRTERGRDPIPLWRLLPIAATLDWKKQRRLWADVSRRVSG